MHPRFEVELELEEEEEEEEEKEERGRLSGRVEVSGSAAERLALSSMLIRSSSSVLSSLTSWEARLEVMLTARQEAEAT